MNHLDRRKFLGSLCAATCAYTLMSRISQAAVPSPRIVALEWRYADHARSLGVTPVGIADLGEYARQSSVDRKELEASGTVDLGRRQEPSMEAIIAARPDLILGVNFRHERILPQLSGIADTVLYKYTQTGSDNVDQLALMLDELRELGEKIGRADAARTATVGLDDFLAKQSKKLASGQVSARRIVFAQFPSGVNNVRLFSSNSLPVQLLDRLGLVNAWTGRSEGFGFTTVGPERLLVLGDVTFLGVAVGSDNSYTRLAKNPLWQSLPFVRSHKFHALTDVVWPFGGVPAAQAFAGKVAETLLPS
ncbi:iron-siderophore ABC transporter substrate-binding protein [Phyllobacterium sp. YR531]|uniref:ABC transporter substrate-binding protein n=1 Tax=Phyllobacterium sp. YR531 TaxID=1144343 RepID=UPI00026FCBA8|nr:iron-siderophore ABC transporter substrate-binding protein [Phyllobacterium sp. YR531]EJN06842.1 ABC-type Fe3+-hydroxamate transport system, periplasmic component [Phyllobacterium sp. YR531]